MMLLDFIIRYCSHINKKNPHFILAVDLDGFEGNDTKESEIMIGEKGIQIAKNISSQIKIAVDNGSLSFTINGTKFIPDKKSLNITEPERRCTKGQTIKDGYCCKFIEK